MKKMTPELESLPEQSTIFRKPRQLYRSRYHRDVPEGAILLSDQELYEVIRKRVQKHPNKSEIYPLLYHGFVTGGMGIFSAGVITTHYRKAFNLRTFGIPYTYGTTCFFAGFCSWIVHSELILRQIYGGYSDCSLCLATQSGVAQLCSGVVYSLVLAPVVTALAAKKLSTHNLQPINSPSLLFGFFKKYFPFNFTMTMLVCANFVVGSYLCERELFTFENVFGRSFDPPVQAPEMITDLK